MSLIQLFATYNCFIDHLTVGVHLQDEFGGRSMLSSLYLGQRGLGRKGENVSMRCSATGFHQRLWDHDIFLTLDRSRCFLKRMNSRTRTWKAGSARFWQCRWQRVANACHLRLTITASRASMLYARLTENSGHGSAVPHLPRTLGDVERRSLFTSTASTMENVRSYYRHL